ncbi:MAG: hypothetical protein IJD79_08720 [Clostridia bacterium]|nr:hypothetical protein [Clostridia bacterium]
MDKYAIIVAGPSGAGKTTVAEGLIASLGTLEMSRSATTRAKRGDGKDDEYVYLSVEEFENSIAKGEVLEYTNYSGNYYGTRKCELDRIWDMDKNPILVLDYNGVKSLKEKLDCPVYAIYVYTSLEEAKRRLCKRDEISGPTEKSRETIVKRVKENVADYKKLYTMAELFDYYAENKNVTSCIEDVKRAVDKLAGGREPMELVEKLKITNTFRSMAANFAE